MSDATEMTLPEALAEIGRLRAMIEDIQHKDPCIADYEYEIKRLRARIVELEAAHAVTLGTLGAPPEPEQPFHVTHNVPGNAPV